VTVPPPPPVVSSDPALVPDATVEVRRVSKWFGQKVAVSDVTCSFGRGVSGLLGPNGAGKTTLLRVLTGLAMPSEGTVLIHGKPPRTDTAVYRDVGLVPEEDAVYGFLTAREFVRFAATLAGIEQTATAADEALEQVGMTDAADRPIRGYSKGMRQRTKVAAALVHRPGILVLDEPLNGTDPVQRAHLIDLFRDLGRNGATVIVSSHVLAEVERMADRVIAMVDGKLAAAGDVTAIRRALSDIPYRVRIDTTDTRRLAAALMAEDVVHSVTVDGERLHVETGDLGALGTAISPLSKRVDVVVTGFAPEDESLESVFRYLVRRR
jgi:ABC-2 type transport system ATP-binding protein